MLLGAPSSVAVRRWGVDGRTRSGLIGEVRGEALLCEKQAASGAESQDARVEVAARRGGSPCAWRGACKGGISLCPAGPLCLNINFLQFERNKNHTKSVYQPVVLAYLAPLHCSSRSLGYLSLIRPFLRSPPRNILSIYYPKGLRCFVLCTSSWDKSKTHRSKLLSQVSPNQTCLFKGMCHLRELSIPHCPRHALQQRTVLHEDVVQADQGWALA